MLTKSIKKKAEEIVATYGYWSKEMHDFNSTLDTDTHKRLEVHIRRLDRKARGLQ